MLQRGTAGRQRSWLTFLPAHACQSTRRSAIVQGSALGCLWAAPLRPAPPSLPRSRCCACASTSTTTSVKMPRGRSTGSQACKGAVYRRQQSTQDSSWYKNTEQSTRLIPLCLLILQGHGQRSLADHFAAIKDPELKFLADASNECDAICCVAVPRHLWDAGLGIGAGPILCRRGSLLQDGSGACKSACHPGGAWCRGSAATYWQRQGILSREGTLFWKAGPPQPETALATACQGNLEPQLWILLENRSRRLGRRDSEMIL